MPLNIRCNRPLMDYRPTHASVTDERCTCGYLEQAAEDSRTPIVFDAEVHEFHFCYQEADCEGLSTLIIYHCPFCGGAAPASKRESLFAVVSAEEENRLAELMSPIKTIEDALDRFGKPLLDAPCVQRHHSQADEDPPTIQHYRSLLYGSLSDVADVRFIEQPDGRVFWTLSGKYLGRNRPAAGRET